MPTTTRLLVAVFIAVLLYFPATAVQAVPSQRGLTVEQLTDRDAIIKRGIDEVQNLDRRSIEGLKTNIKPRSSGSLQRREASQSRQANAKKASAEIKHVFNHKVTNADGTMNVKNSVAASKRAKKFAAMRKGRI
ncbi:hypothetical protein HDU67_000763 [Dinochytrium kinnereticum]|nr:hypothetical protein HDU67_000763 [Dinochytrium kinnereticum]